MKKLLFILSVLFFISCSNQEVDKKSFSEKIVVTKNQHSEVEYDDSMLYENIVEVDTSELLSEQGDYENPFFIYGTDFGNFFKTLYKHGKFNEMLKFTSTQSKKQFGEDVVLDFYKNQFDFGYDIGKKPISNGTYGDIITLNYRVNIMATKKIIRINIIIENDSCKIVLPEKLETTNMFL